MSMARISLVLPLGILLAPLCAQRSVPDTPKTTDAQVMRRSLEQTKVSLQDAIGRAVDHAHGTPIHAAFERTRVGGQLVPRYRIELLDGDTFCDVEIDALSGEVVRSAHHELRAALRTGEMSFSFEDDGLPGGFIVGETAGKGTPASWSVQTIDDAPSGKQVLAVEAHNTKGTFNLFERRGKVGPDLILSTRIQAVTGEEDRGGGVYWRAKDQDNYYIARWNPLESNLRVYTVIDGKRSLPLESAQVDGAPDAWHLIEVETHGERILIRFDGKIALECEDKTFTEAGAVGLWTKSDASSRFDDLRVWPQKSD
ncbi:MAG: PepSY domain-containing protein [Planctomycetota bacterium]